MNIHQGDVHKNNAPVIGAFERAKYMPKPETIAVYYAESTPCPSRFCALANL